MQNQRCKGLRKIFDKLELILNLPAKKHLIFFHPVFSNFQLNTQHNLFQLTGLIITQTLYEISFKIY